MHAMSLNYDHGHLRVTYHVHDYVPYTKIGAVPKTIIFFGVIELLGMCILYL